MARSGRRFLLVHRDFNTLTAGTLYTIELQYYENSGDAVCRLHWSYPGQANQAIPSSQLYPAGQ